MAVFQLRSTQHLLHDTQSLFDVPPRAELRVEDVPHDAARIDDVCDATVEDPEGSGYPEAPPKLAIAIGQETEREAMLLSEPAMTDNAVRAHADDSGARPDELVMIVAEPTSLRRATRRVVPRIEVEDEAALRQQLAERRRFAVLIGQREFRDTVAGLQAHG